MDENNQNKNLQPSVNNSKTGMGVLLGFLGLIGLLIGMLLYKEDTYERKTFLKGWLWTFIVAIVAGVVIGLIVYFTTMSQIASIVNRI